LILEGFDSFQMPDELQQKAPHFGGLSTVWGDLGDRSSRGGRSPGDMEE
jgi:hypothetical protein